ncbi:hypothetical protein B0H19DRAFT_1381691 [Mycena capillaripes]|nr:hypothetical protein B0H19DRAFT_1381691 [Mycena capillaripes]
MAGDSSPPAPLRLRLATILREFIITVVLAFLCLLAILHTVQYHVRIFLSDAPPSTDLASSPCARVSLHLAALSPLDVLKITVICAALVFLGMEAAARILSLMGWTPARRTHDVEARFATIEGDGWRDEKAESELRPDLTIAS